MRWGLVLGGGGVLGGAWMTGALTALERVHGLDAREAHLLVGTSAGSVTAALLASGVSVSELRAHALGAGPGSGPLATADWDHDRSAGAASPPRPRLAPGSPALLGAGARHLRRLPPTALVSAMLPEGRGSIDAVGRLVRSVAGGGAWPHPGLRVVAMDYETGRRTAFGAPEAPAAPLPEAVMASCAIPGWYAPVRIGDHRYVDGGACSATNVDLAAGLGLDVVHVLAPMVSFSVDAPTHWRARLERRYRAAVTRRCLREVVAVHRSGTEVTVLGPGREDLEAMGANLMDAGRRRRVLETALRTTEAELRDPEPLPALPDLPGALPDLPGSLDADLLEDA